MPDLVVKRFTPGRYQVRCGEHISGSVHKIGPRQWLSKLRFGNGKRDAQILSQSLYAARNEIRNYIADIQREG
jgi:hypothetical protein